MVNQDFYLNQDDYKKILDFYSVTYNNNAELRQLAENILATKLCRCIKKLKRTTFDEKTSVAICANSIFKKRNLKYNRFSCKKDARLRGKSMKKTRKKLRYLSK